MPAGLAVLGAIVSLAALSLAAVVLRAGNSIGFAALGIIIIVAFISYPLGVITGIVVINRILKVHGSLWLGVAGSLLGPAIVAALLEPVGLSENSTILFSAFLISSPVLSSLGYLVGGRLGWGRENT